MFKRAWQTGWLPLLLAAPATAGSLRVDPVQVLISDIQQTAAVTITNREDAPVTVHTYPLAWTQPNGTDLYSETSDVIVSPRIVTIPPSGTQLVRVGFRKSADERSAWRLVIEEVPELGHGSGVQVALRMNLPLLSGVKAGTPANLRWSVWRDSDGEWTVEAFNEGAGFVRVNAADFVSATGIHHDDSLRLGVVLPNSRRVWRLSSRPTLIDAAQFQRIARAEGADDRMAVISARN